MNNATKSETVDLGNNEVASVGIFEQADGTYLALALSASKYFKTYRGAERWLVNRFGK